MNYCCIICVVIYSATNPSLLAFYKKSSVNAMHERDYFNCSFLVLFQLSLNKYAFLSFSQR